MSEPSTRGLDPGGHVSALMLGRLVTDAAEAQTDAHANARAHLVVCARCREAHAALVAADHGLAVSPLIAGPVLAPRPRPLPSQRWPKIALAVAGPLALAVIVLLVVRPPPDVADANGVTRDGGAIDFEVYVNDGTQRRLVDSGAEVHPGDRVSFRVLARVAGHLLVVGSDEAGHMYRCWPQDHGAAIAGDVVAPAFGPTPEPEELAAAMRFDDVLGGEHLVAVFCADAFTFSQVASDQLVMQGGALLADFRQAHPTCAVREVVLHKVHGASTE